jgi:hypothetical protein
MDNKKNITEEDKFELKVTGKDLKNSQTTATLADIQKNNKNIEVVLSKDQKGMSISDLLETDEILEPEAVIAPQDKATIKYLSNVKDSNTGEISQPFNIGDKSYQMIRGVHPSGEIGLAVFCHDDMNEIGENVIHPVEYFEENIALPMKEAMGMVGKDIQVVDEDTYEGYKHYLVNKQTNEIRKFKTIEEILSCNKSDEEEYMGVGSFKKFTNERLFGARKRKDETINEVTPTGEETDEEMNTKAKKLMDLIGKRIPINIIKTIKTPIAQREVIAAFAEMIGVPRQGLPNLINGLKDLAKPKPKDGKPAAPAADGTTPLPADNQLAPLTEKKIMTKAELTESLSKPKVIKRLKVKDIK